jgi:prepilin-type N-terminal cleavage/methylation domain-containing protein
VKRLRAQQGMTLVEVLVAMFVLSIGIMAIVAGLASGILTVQRSGKTSSAGAIADRQMEAFRGISYPAIATTNTPTDGVYENTAAPYSSPYDATWKIVDNTLSGCVQNYCAPTQTITAAGGTYRVDTYVNWKCPTPGSTLTAGSPPTCSDVVISGVTIKTRSVKQVTIIVRNNSDQTKTLFRETSNFDALTG